MAKEKKYRKRYRVQIMDNETHKSVLSFKNTPLFLILLSTLSFFFLLALVTLIVSYTPLRQFIPGYPSAKTRQTAIQNAIKVDSLEREIHLWSLQLTNIQKVVTGQAPINIDSLLKENTDLKDLQEAASTHSKYDSLLREEVQDTERFLLNSRDMRIDQIEGLLFFTPVKGVVSQDYNPNSGHPYIDVATPEGATVSSVLDGTVIATFWDDNTGHNILIQHDNNLISIYKHNLKLFKSIGDKVKAGTPISTVGNIGTLSTGSHLHFELWHKGEPINPSKYIKF